MLTRFCLYGFLKNQRYFEAYFVLFLIAEKLSFLEIGMLIALREGVTNFLEIPSGAFADAVGRRLSLVLAFASYTAGYLLFGASHGLLAFVPAIVLLSFGDAFRSGTHKAIIFDWLRSQGREGERTRIYGTTRSWSLMGSALSMLIGLLIVLVFDSYRATFYCSALPAALNIVNFLGYPPESAERVSRRKSPRAVLREAVTGFRSSLARPGIRALMLETMGFEGIFGALKTYLQPVLVLVSAAWLSPGAVTGLDAEPGAIAPVVAGAYCVLYIVSSFVSRKSHLVAEKAGGIEPAARRIWFAVLLAYVAWIVMETASWMLGVAIVLVLLHIVQNLWRPIQISRFDEVGSAEYGATLLSIESQARRLSTAAFALLFGAMVDAQGAGGFDLRGVAACGLVAAAFALLTRRAKRR